MNTFQFYNLSVELRMLLADAEASGGEIDAETEGRLRELMEASEDGVEQFALAVKELDRTAESVEAVARPIRAEADRVAARARSKRAASKRLRTLICDHMGRTGTPQVKTGLVTVSYLESEAEPIWVGKDDRIPDEYRKTIVEHLLDVDRVQFDRANGKTLPDDIRFPPKKGIRIL